MSKADGIDGSDVLPALTFDTDDYEPSERFDAMNDVTKGLQSYRIIENDGCGETGIGERVPMLKAKAWSVGATAAIAFQNSPVIIETSQKGDSIFTESLIVLVPRRGRHMVSSDAGEALLRPGMVYLINNRRTVYETDSCSGISLRVPYDLLGYDPLRQSGVLSYSSDRWVGNVVETAMHSLFEALPTMTQAEARTAEPCMTALIKSLLCAGRPDDEAQAAIGRSVAHAMKRYVLEHLGDQDLDAHRLQCVFNSSRASVYRAFKDVGGVAAFIRQERLAACHRELSGAARRHGTIRHIAGKYGYWDQGVFSRAFLNQYGVRPSEMLGTGHPSRDPAASASETPPGSGMKSLASFWSANCTSQLQPVAT